LAQECRGFLVNLAADMKFLTPLFLVATICFSSHMLMSAANATPAQPEPSSTHGNERQLLSFGWVFRLAKYVPWKLVFATIGHLDELASVADLFGGFDERRLSTGSIDWHSGKGAKADGAIHHWVHLHTVEIEDLMEPSLKAETLTHTPMEIDNALSEAFEEFAEEHPGEIAQTLRGSKDTDSVVSKVESQVGSDGAKRLPDATKTYNPSILVTGVFSLAGMTVLFVAARSGFQRARLGLSTQHSDGLQRARLDLASQHAELESVIE